jgi:hypothetical protein
VILEVLCCEHLELDDGAAMMAGRQHSNVVSHQQQISSTSGVASSAACYSSGYSLCSALRVAGQVTARYRAALALAGLARCQPLGSRTYLTLMAEAANYVAQVVNAPGSDAASLQAAAAKALAEYQAAIAAATGRR